MTRIGTGALVWAGFDGAAVPGHLLDAIRDGAIGGLVLFAYRGNIASKDQVRGMLVEAQAAARDGGLPPIPIGIDQEGGSVVRIGYRPVFPSAMAIAATDDAGLAERAAAAVASGLLADGITVNHAPVCDVNVDPRNPVIGTRSFGDDAVRVAELAAAWVRGSERAGVAATAKHFPGHGDTAVDSHLARPTVRADTGTLAHRDLVPFRAAIAAGVSSVMTAHVVYPALDRQAPATLSSPIVTDLLRRELAFAGLCITDSLDMAGIAEAGPRRAVTAAIGAGVDAVMVTSGADRQRAAAGWIDAEVPESRRREALGRALRFRERFARAGPGSEVDDEPAKALAAEIAERSITQVGPPLPRLAEEVRAAYFAPRRASAVEELAAPDRNVERALRARFGARLRFAVGDAPPGNGTLVVFSSDAYLREDQAADVRRLLSGGGILCATRSPYDAALVPSVPALLSYGDVPASIEALVAALAGERAASGRLPVRLPTST